MFENVSWKKSSRSDGQTGNCLEMAIADHAIWRKSSRSDNNGGQCVEVAIAEIAVGVRDSKDPEGAVLAFTADDWAAFLSGVKNGEFDR